MVDQQRRLAARRRSRADARRAPRSRVVSSPAAGSSSISRRGLRGERARDADQLAMALRAGRPGSPWRPSRGRTGRASPRSRAGRCASRNAILHAGERVLGDGEVLLDEQVVEQLAALPGPREPELRARVRGAGRRGRDRRARPARSLRTKPVTASTNVVLPAPLGPIRPTSSPSPTSKLTSRSACTPPKSTDRPVRGAAPAAGRARRSRLPRARRRRPGRAGRRPRRDDRRLRCVLLVERAGDALGVLQQRDDQDHAAEQQERSCR